MARVAFLFSAPSPRGPDLVLTCIKCLPVDDPNFWMRRGAAREQRIDSIFRGIATVRSGENRVKDCESRSDSTRLTVLGPNWNSIWGYLLRADFLFLLFLPSQ